MIPRQYPASVFNFSKNNYLNIQFYTIVFPGTLLAKEKGRNQGVDMLRIDVKSHTDVETVLKLSGWLSGREVDTLRREGEARQAETRRLVIDLSGLRFIDRSGLDLLERWAGGGAVLCGGTLFIHSLLAGRGLANRQTL